MLENIEGLTPELKAQIEETLKAQFVAKTEFDAVLAKKEELLGEKKSEQKKAQEAAAAAELAKLEAAKKSGDVESLTASYEAKLKEATEQLNTIQNGLKAEKIGSMAKQFVGEKFVNDPVIAEAISEKFSRRIDMREGKTVVLDADGNLTALSIDDLKEEFLKNGQYKAHIISTNASGGGATGGKTTTTGGGAAKDLTQAKTKAERIAVISARMANN